MARKPTSRRPRKADIKAAADRAEARAKGKPVEKPEEHSAINPPETRLGRPPTYRPEYAQQAAKLCRLGATDPELADFFGVSARTVARWKVKHEDFCQAIKPGYAEADDRVERSMYHKAVGYTYTVEELLVVKGEVVRELVEKHVPPDTTAAIFWLKNRRPKAWRDVWRHEHGGVGDFDKMTDDELKEFIRTSVEMTAPGKSGKPTTGTTH